MMNTILWTIALTADWIVLTFCFYLLAKLGRTYLRDRRLRSEMDRAYTGLAALAKMAGRQNISLKGDHHV